MPKKLKFWREPSVREATGFLTVVTVLERVVFTEMKNTGGKAALGTGLMFLSLRCLGDVIKLFEPHQILSLKEHLSSLYG